MEEKVIYWDIQNKKITEKRKKDIKFEYLIAVLLIIAISIGNLPNLVYSENKNTESLIIAILIWMSTIFVILLIIKDRFALQKSKVNRGVKLTLNELQIYNTYYPIYSIIYCEVVDFLGTGGIYSISNPNMDRWLAIVIKNKRGKKKIRLLRSTETTDIMKLCNLIRKLKGLPVQGEIKQYGSTIGFHKWKKEILREVENL